jgi:hypothetical protein
VAIFQRRRVAGAMTDHGTDSPRVIHAVYRLDKQEPLLLVGCYMPVKSRGVHSHPNQDDIWRVVRERMGKAPPRALKYLLFDANAEPARNIKGVVGKYSVRPRHTRPMDDAGIRLVENLRDLGMCLISTMNVARPSTEGGTGSWAPRSDPSKRFQLDHVAGNRRALECTEDVHLDWLATRQALGEAVDHAAIVATVQGRLTRWAPRSEARPFRRMAEMIESEKRSGETALRDAWRQAYRDRRPGEIPDSLRQFVRPELLERFNAHQLAESVTAAVVGRQTVATAAQHRHWICTRFPGPCLPADLAGM